MRVVLMKINVVPKGIYMADLPPTNPDSKTPDGIFIGLLLLAVVLVIVLIVVTR
jgi:hypothetical protein